MAIPNDPEALLERKPLSSALKEAGFRVASATLATKASRGGGPPYQKFGSRALYPWGTALEWARSKLGPLVTHPGALAGAPGAGDGIAGRRSGTHTTSAAAEPAPRRMTLISWRPCRRNTLRGFTAVELPSGLRIMEIPVHVTAGRAWAGLPARPMVDNATGTALRDERGKIRYSPVLSWRDRDLADRWSDAVVALVRAAHPAALDGEDRR
jgi:hypothetical protein